MCTGSCPVVKRSAVQPKTTRLCSSIIVISLCVERRGGLLQYNSLFHRFHGAINVEGLMKKIVLNAEFKSVGIYLNIYNHFRDKSKICYFYF